MGLSYRQIFEATTVKNSKRAPVHGVCNDMLLTISYVVFEGRFRAVVR